MKANSNKNTIINSKEDLGATDILTENLPDDNNQLENKENLLDKTEIIADNTNPPSSNTP